VNRRWVLRACVLSIVLIAECIATQSIPASGTSSAATTTAPPQNATVRARATGERVEVPELRTETMQVFANPSGNFTAEITAAPVRVRRGGEWLPVDTTLRRLADGSVAPRAASLGMTFSGGGSGPLARLRKGQ
jgi:hypothetical protein